MSDCEVSYHSASSESENKPWLTISIAVYNAEQFFSKCLASIANQSFRDFEVIIVDDGSTDDSLSIAQKFAEKDARFRVYSNSHKGAYSTKAEAFELARGEYVLSCDADDYFVNNAFQIIYNTVKDGEYELIQFNYWTKYNYIKLINKLPYKIVTLNAEKFRDEEYIRMLCGEVDHTRLKGYLWCKLFHCRLLKNLPSPSARADFFMGDDMLLNMHLLKDCKSALFINKPLYVYRILTGNSVRFRKNALKDSDYLKKYQFAFLEGMNQQLQAKAKLIIYTSIAKDIFYFTNACINNVSIKDTEQYLCEALSLPTVVKAKEYFIKNCTGQNELWIDLIRQADPLVYIDVVQACIRSESMWTKVIKLVKRLVKRII